jgi:hypothetical protein
MVRGTTRQIDTSFDAAGIEQTQLHTLGDLRIERKIRTRAIARGS